MSTIVVMPGGFHPFHAGHAALYNSARRAFPDAEVFVAATNDTSTRPFPFAIKEKLAKLAGVEPGHFVQVKSPFQAKEITAQFNPEQDKLIFVRSEKDASKPPQAGGVKKDGSPSYLQPLLGAKKLEPFGKRAYMAYLPTVEFGPGMTSATEIRTAWPQLNDKRKQALVMSLYPKTQSSPALAANIVKMLDTAMGSEELNEFAPDDSGGSRKFIPWPEFIDAVKQIVGKDFSVKENVVKSTIKARFIPHDPMEYGPTMLYSYYEARAGRNKGAVSTRGSIQVGKYFDKGSYFNSSDPDIQNQLLTSFNLLKGHPFERHFDLTFDNIYKIANIIMGNTEGAYQIKSQQGIAEAAKKCPPATQDITLNLANRQKAIDEYGYGPLNPDMPNNKFWMAKVDEWNLDSAEEAKQSLCGNCAAFDIRQDTLDCIAQGIDSDNPADAEGIIDAGELGYCKFLKFKCASRRTCDAWVTGGPLVDKPNIAEGPELMTDAQFYRDLLAVVAGLGTGVAAAAFFKIRDAIKLYNANKILAALEGRGITNIAPQEKQQLQQLIDQFKQAAEQRDGATANKLATQINTIATEHGVTETLAGTSPQGFVGGMYANYQSRENQPIAEKSKLPKAQDSEMIKNKQFVKQHYPTYSSDPDVAFDKWVMRSLKHSEQEDAQHDRTLDRLTKKVDQLSAQLKQAQSNSGDYMEETSCKK